MQNLQQIALWLSDNIAKMGPFTLLSDGKSIPVFAFRLRDATHFSVYDISERLKMRGWQVPAYTLPQAAENLAVLRIVLREGFSRDMGEILLRDFRNVLDELKNDPPRHPKAPAGVPFHH
jgi:glutamate decarboxylase